MPVLPDLTATVRFDDAGLVPVVIQDWSTGEVLTLAYANDEALTRTRETGELHLWSRSRDELWHKGATSGNVQKVRALRIDCDQDAVLALVEPAGPACHTGARTCFHPVGAPEGPAADDWAPEGEGVGALLAPHEVLPDLVRVLADRRANAPEGSYTAQLLNDRAFAGGKVEEEAEEVFRAAREETDDRVDNEAADVLYHLLALIQGRDRTLDDVLEVLRQRRA
ncbi:bifunctional phosphoribosyl-AMP cyclohydrolase/phosphoribosyl-ATP diphosphatase HisIE [Patulibacter minatonensis]|uniref:bifunctional phosphoribosyl-AMP cyclohydrolase/phosphoribosyl-ATP diphosphatase HisIE n=1 Tax=Patulibacter minatonensis TaxID=298163 RepID=UPI001B7F90F9|nr:bifunctional phosphoribosyl-AMP cyclohydrolase/phosphoribosyl-ATP diphosphatase HisIE [Patulibacter minatonensis]